MRIILCSILFTALSSVTYAQSDSLPGASPHFKDLRQGSVFQHPPNPAVRVDPDGVVIGSRKFFILIVRPDPSIDYRMLKMGPEGRGTGKVPRRLPVPPIPRVEPR